MKFTTPQKTTTSCPIFLLVILALALQSCISSETKLQNQIEHEIQNICTNEDQCSTPYYNYTAVLSSLTLDNQKKSALRNNQTRLGEQVMLLKMREVQLNRLVSDELIKHEPDKSRLKVIMDMLIKNGQDVARFKLKAMLNARQIIRSGLTKDQIQSAKANQAAILMLE